MPNDILSQLRNLDQQQRQQTQRQAEQRAAAQQRPDYRQYIATRQQEDAMLDWMHSNYKIAKTGADVHKGYTPNTQAVVAQLLPQFAYNQQRRSANGKNALSFGDPNYDPWGNDDSSNEEWSDFYKSHGRAPTQSEVDTMRGQRYAKLEGVAYDPNRKQPTWDWASMGYNYDSTNPDDVLRQKYRIAPASALADYGSDTVDQQRKQQGLPPLKVDRTQTLVKQIGQYQNDIQQLLASGRYNDQTAANALAKYKELSAANDLYAKQANGSTDAESYYKGGTSDLMSKYYNADVLKKNGYNSDTGFDSVNKKYTQADMVAAMRSAAQQAMGRQQPAPQTNQGTTDTYERGADGKLHLVSSAANGQQSAQPTLGVWQSIVNPDAPNANPVVKGLKKASDLMPENLVAKYVLPIPGMVTKNAVKALDDTVQGKPLGFDPNVTALDLATRSAQIARAKGDTQTADAIDWLVNTPAVKQIFGFMGEAALDPSTYFGAGAFGKIAKLAKAGKTAEAAKVAEQAAQQAAEAARAAQEAADAEKAAQAAKQVAAEAAPQEFTVTRGLQKPKAQPENGFDIQGKYATPPNVRTVDNIHAPAERTPVPASKVPEGATTKPLSSALADESLSKQMNAVDSYKPAEHVVPYKAQGGKTHYVLTDENGNELARYDDYNRAVTGGQRYRERLYQGITTPQTKLLPKPYVPEPQKLLPLPRQMQASDSIANSLRTVPRNPSIASDSMGNMLRGSTAPDAGTIRMPQPARPWLQEPPTNGATSATGSALDSTSQLDRAIANARRRIGLPVQDTHTLSAETPKYMAQKAQNADELILTPSSGNYNPAPDGAPAYDATKSPSQTLQTGNAQRRTLLQVWRDMWGKTLDRDAGARLASDATYKKAVLSSNAGTQVGHILDTALVDKNGKAVGKSVSQLFGDTVPKGQEVDFWEYMLQRHNVDRAAEGKPIYSRTIDGKEYSLTPQDSADRVAYLDRQHPDWNKRADEITTWLDKFMKTWGVDSGLVDKDVYQTMRDLYQNYIPTNRAFSDLEDFVGGAGNGAKGFVDTSSPIKSATGSERNIIDPRENIINLVRRTVMSARKNEVGQELVKAVQQNPAMSAIARIVDHDPGNVDNVVSVLVDGKPVHVEINDPTLLETMLNMNKAEDLNGLEKMVKGLNQGFKALITSKNPLFAIRNIARDVPTYLTQSQVNPAMALGRLGTSFKDIAVTDIVNPALKKLTANRVQLAENPLLAQYRGMGAEGSNFVGRSTAKTAAELTGRVPIMDKAGNIAGYRNISPVAKAWRWMGENVWKLNDAMETAPRYAEFRNALAKGKNLTDALYDAAEITTNFSKGGKLAKSVDTYVPFFNASVQGIARVARALNPAHPIQAAKTILKGATSITVPVAILYGVNRNNPNYWEVSQRTRDNYLLIPNVNDLDNSGNPRTFIKLPKSREYGVLFGSAFERAMAAADGRPDPFKGFGSTISLNVAPANPISDNLITGAWTGLKSNKDFAGRTIVPQSMSGRSPMNQYDETTSEVAKWMGRAANDIGLKEGGLSPKQIDFILKYYTGVYGQVGLPLTVKGNQGTNPLAGVGKAITTQFTADPLYSSQTISDFYEKMDKLNKVAQDKNFTEDIPGEVTTPEERAYSVMTKASKSMSELSKEVDTSEDPASVRAYMIHIAETAQRLNSSGIPYIAPYQVALKDAKGNNLKDESGATVYHDLTRAEWDAYQKRLEAAYKKITGDSYYKSLDASKKAKMLQSRMNSAIDQINKDMLKSAAH